MSYLEKRHRIFVAGHKGLVGGAIVDQLVARGYEHILVRDRSQLDLTEQRATYDFFRELRPNVVFLAAAKVGGIHANDTFPADFICQNLQIQTNVLWAAHLFGVERLVFLGSSCVYPRLAPQPIPETSLLSGDLESTNRPYAIAKIAGLELVQSLRRQFGRSYFSVMPTNLYGPRDNFHPSNSHVLPALLRRIHEAKIQHAEEVVVWGTGAPLREFLMAGDAADAIVHLAEHLDDRLLESSALGRCGWSHINVGSGQEVSIRDLAHLISDVVGYTGRICFDSSKPDGTPRKLVDSSFLKSLGWSPKVDLRQGIGQAYAWFLANQQTYRNS